MRHDTSSGARPDAESPDFSLLATSGDAVSDGGVGDGGSNVVRRENSVRAELENALAGWTGEGDPERLEADLQRLLRLVEDARKAPDEPPTD